MSWSNGFLGITWTSEDTMRQGTHCWGLVRLVYAECLQIEAGDYGPAPSDRAVTAGLMMSELARFPWKEVPFDAPLKAFDLVVIERAGLDDHVGIVVDQHLMLHLPAGSESKVERIADLRWRRRIVRIYRHEGVS